MLNWEKLCKQTSSKLKELVAGFKKNENNAEGLFLNNPKFSTYINNVNNKLKNKEKLSDDEVNFMCNLFDTKVSYEWNFRLLNFDQLGFHLKRYFLFTFYERLVKENDSLMEMLISNNTINPENKKIEDLRGVQMISESENIHVRRLMMVEFDVILQNQMSFELYNQEKFSDLIVHSEEVFEHISEVFGTHYDNYEAFKSNVDVIDNFVNKMKKIYSKNMPLIKDLPQLIDLIDSNSSHDDISIFNTEKIINGFFEKSKGKKPVRDYFMQMSKDNPELFIECCKEYYDFKALYKDSKKESLDKSYQQANFKSPLGLIFKELNLSNNHLVLWMYFLAKVKAFHQDDFFNMIQCTQTLFAGKEIDSIDVNFYTKQYEHYFNKGKETSLSEIEQMFGQINDELKAELDEFVFKADVMIKVKMLDS